MSLAVFPIKSTLAWNSVKKQKWNTKVQRGGTGIRKTLAMWAYPEWEIKAGFTSLTAAEMEDIAGFCAQVKGAFSPFLWLDPEDYQETAVQIGLGTGAAAQYQLLRNYNSRFVEPVRDIVSGSLTVYNDGVAAAATLGTDGVVTCTGTSGKAITATFQYYWRVAFKDDDNDWEYFLAGFYRMKTIEMVTVK